MSRRHFEPANKTSRRQYHHAAALECEAGGFSGFASFHREMAALLTPRMPRVTTEAKDERQPDRAPKRKQWQDSLPEVV